MGIPIIGSIPLINNTSIGSSGGAFILSTPPKSSAVLDLGGAEIEICAKESYAVIRFYGAQDATSTFTNAHRLIQEGLDLCKYFFVAAILNQELSRFEV